LLNTNPAKGTVTDQNGLFRLEQVGLGRIGLKLQYLGYQGRVIPNIVVSAGQALALEQTYGLPIAHETHRSRITFSPWDTSQLLTTFGDIKLTCDFSHWVTVCERLLDRESAILEQCAQHCVHIHARVGYEQGPQVTHPNAPEWAAHLAAHERWWQQIWQAQVQCGMAVSTLTPEYGPPNYHHTLPFSQEPVSDLWAICDWQWHREKAHFDRFSAEILTQSYS